jgi:hypothetical protein
MKKSFNDFMRIAITFIAVFAFMSARATDPAITVNYTGTAPNPGDIISVPVVIDGSTYTIGGFEIWIEYNTDILTYVNTTNVYSGLTSIGFWNSTPFPTQTNYKHKLSWGAFFGGTPLANQVICNLNFKFNGGTTNFSFYFNGIPSNPTASYIMDDAYVFLSATWTGGAVTGQQAVITSVPGGGLWTSAASWNLGHVPNTSNSTVVIASALSTPLVISTDLTGTWNLEINPSCALTLNPGKTFNLTGNVLIKTDARGPGTLQGDGTLNTSRTLSDKQK